MAVHPARKYQSDGGPSPDGIAELLRRCVRFDRAQKAVEAFADALAYPDFYEPKVKLAMKIGSDYRLSSIGRSAWYQLGQELRLDPGRLVERVRELAERAPAAFVEAAADPAVHALRSDLPARLASKVTDRANRCSAALAAGRHRRSDG